MFGVYTRGTGKGRRQRRCVAGMIYTMRLAAGGGGPYNIPGERRQMCLGKYILPGGGSTLGNTETNRGRGMARALPEHAEWREPAC